MYDLSSRFYKEVYTSQLPGMVFEYVEKYNKIQSVEIC